MMGSLLSRSGSIKVDIYDRASIDALFNTIHDIDAVVCVAARGALTPLESLSDEAVEQSLNGKLLGQIALFLRAVRYLRDGGSITLTSGVFREPMIGSAMGGLVNAGLEGFVRNVAPELPRGIRVNVLTLPRPEGRGFFLHPACLRVVAERRRVAAGCPEAFDETPSSVPVCPTVPCRAFCKIF
ncbi:SDR family oxidoreductase, partial [Thermosporothrix hazakensis]